MARSALLAVLVLVSALASAGCQSPVASRLGGNPVLSKFGFSPVPPQWEPEIDADTQEATAAAERP